MIRSGEGPVHGIICSGESDHLDEIAEILAAGLRRLAAQKSSRKPANCGESSLHFSPDRSGGVPSYSAEALHD